MAAYKPPSSVSMLPTAIEGAQKMLVKGGNEGKERFGLFSGRWADDTLVISDTTDVSDTYASERAVNGVSLHEWAREEMRNRINNGRKTGKGIVGQCHIHMDGGGALEPKDIEMLEKYQAGVMGIIYYDVYCGMGIDIYHANLGAGKGPVCLLSETIKDARIPRRALRTFEYYWELGNTDLFG